MKFDFEFTQLLRHGDIAAAKTLLVKKYPHLKTDSDRVNLYVQKYQKLYKITVASKNFHA
jgi:hypothetical protein